MDLTFKGKTNPDSQVTGPTHFFNKAEGWTVGAVNTVNAGRDVNNYYATPAENKEQGEVPNPGHALGAALTIQ